MMKTDTQDVLRHPLLEDVVQEAARNAPPHDVLASLQSRLEGFQPRQKEAKVRAAVNIVLRVRPHESDVDEAVAQRHGDVDDLLAANWVRRGELELLFLKRAANPRDPWSGHVAFPGGHVENQETDCEAAIREAMEEVGLDLADASRFQTLGRLDDRMVPRRSRKVMAVAAFVWLQIVAETPPVTLQESEVAAYRFVPVHVLLHAELRDSLYHPVTMPMQRVIPALDKLPALFGMKQIHFTGYVLPPQPPRKPGATSTDGEAECDGERYVFHLWGLTLGMTTEAFSMAHPEGRKMNLPPVRFDNRVIDWLAGLIGGRATSPENINFVTKAATLSVVGGVVAGLVAGGVLLTRSLANK